jgi:hypothetical protein
MGQDNTPESAAAMPCLPVACHEVHLCIDALQPLQLHGQLLMVTCGALSLHLCLCKLGLGCLQLN